MRGPRPPRIVWRRWLTFGIFLFVLGMVGFVLGIWGDDRWAGTGVLFFVPGVILMIVAALTLAELPYPDKEPH